MKVRPLLSGLAVVLLLGAEDKPTLKEFTSREGGFSVQVPGEMKETVKNVKSPGGKNEVQRTYTYAPSPNTVYLLLDRDMAALKKADAETVAKALDNSRKAAEQALKGKLLGEKKVTLGKHPGLEFQIESAQLGVYRSRVYIADGRMYQITVMGPRDVVTSKTADDYLQSFKLLDRK
jgi:hypothetical protein